MARSYKRKSNGQFAGGGGGSGSGTRVTAKRVASPTASARPVRTRSSAAVRRQAVQAHNRKMVKRVAIGYVGAYAAAGAIHMAGNRVTPARLSAARSNRLKKQSNSFRQAENHHLKRLPVSAMIVKAAVNGVHQVTQVL